MIVKYLKMLISLGDTEFNQIYPDPIRKLADKHWTPIEVAKKASEFLVAFPGAKILDIGSGAGKFCVVGAACTKGLFTGVEQREPLVDLSRSIAATFKLRNAQFLRANMMDIAFSDYNAFYFFNSFYENLAPGTKIDDTVATGPEYYVKYCVHLTRELSKTPPGTRLVTYWNCLWEVPDQFQRQSSDFDGLLEFWEKKSA